MTLLSLYSYIYVLTSTTVSRSYSGSEAAASPHQFSTNFLPADFSCLYTSFEPEVYISPGAVSESIELMAVVNLDR